MQGVIAETGYREAHEVTIVPSFISCTFFSLLFSSLLFSSLLFSSLLFSSLLVYFLCLCLLFYRFDWFSNDRDLFIVEKFAFQPRPFHDFSSTLFADSRSIRRDATRRSKRIVSKRKTRCVSMTGSYGLCRPANCFVATRTC